ncbi:MAG: hypothetical protein JWN37_647 [Candidatus Nomurabacteria bacterium]|nr:hypothetical protein [Candidatus Nomurabacteria bacterium]
MTFHKHSLIVLISGAGIVLIILIALIVNIIRFQNKPIENVPLKSSATTTPSMENNLKVSDIIAKYEPASISKEGFGSSYFDQPGVKISFKKSDLSPVYFKSESGGVNYIIVFYPFEITKSRQHDNYIDHTTDNYYNMYLFTPTNGGYLTKFITTISPNGGSPEIKAAFFANADKDPEDEIIVLTAWPQDHADIQGILYGVDIYDDPKHMSDVNNDFMSECECNSNGQHETALYTNEAAIRKHLKDLGY